MQDKACVHVCACERCPTRGHTGHAASLHLQHISRRLLMGHASSLGATECNKTFCCGSVQGPHVTDTNLNSAIHATHHHDNKLRQRTGPEAYLFLCWYVLGMAKFRLSQLHRLTHVRRKQAAAVSNADGSLHLVTCTPQAAAQHITAQHSITTGAPYEYRMLCACPCTMLHHPAVWCSVLNVAAAPACMQSCHS